MDSSLWASLLSSAASVSSAPTAGLLVLGPARCQKSVIARIHKHAAAIHGGPRGSSLPGSRNVSGSKTAPSYPMAHDFGPGYSFIDFTDENDDSIAKLDVFSLDEVSDESRQDAVKFAARVLGRFHSLNQKALVVVLLDWSDNNPKSWASGLSQWLSIVRDATSSLDTSQTVKDIQHRLQTYAAPSANSADGQPAANDAVSSIELPLEEGQYDLPLGADILLATVGTELVAETVSVEDPLDSVQQYLRTVGLRHGASLVYLPYTLDIPNTSFLDLLSERLELSVDADSPLGRKTAPSAVDRAGLTIPSGWDSRGKILAVRDGFSINKASDSWLTDDRTSIDYYESLVPRWSSQAVSTDSGAAHTTKIDFQQVLQKHYETLQLGASVAPATSTPTKAVNIGGIQLDSVEDMVRRRKSREAASAANTTANTSTDSLPATPDRRADSAVSTPGSAQNEVLANFFQHLLNKHKSSPSQE